ncbi:glycosyltransferase family 2 protein [Rhodohalobacter sp. 614A]|uniref:glycosyltransferase family 2 protein n=1 Tax=Rhodohalobacter sp. 614A TaxID=2908649 RepID=UPI001F3FB846|nr:glycosyltransferase family 2 protein [Rhodohalobacter sp. 614A]
MSRAYPLVSIIIPTFNRAQCLGRAIESVIKQTYPSTEIIVVDDGSYDETPHVVSKYNNIIYIRKPNGGQASARNAGLQHAKGKYVASLDSDDQWEKNFLTECISMLEQENLSFVFANWNQQYGDAKFRNYFSSCTLLEPFLPKSETEESWIFLDRKKIRKIYTDGCPSPSSSLVLRASLLEDGWNEEMSIGDDWCMLLDIILRKNVTAAFTTQLLWNKFINYNNIVDGRDPLEVYKLLWVDDVHRLIKRHKKNLSPEELANLEKKYIKSLLMSAKMNFFKNSKYKNSIKFFKQALEEYPLCTTQIFYEQLYKYTTRLVSPSLNKK